MKISNTKHVKTLGYALVFLSLLPVMGVFTAEKSIYEMIFILVFIFFVVAFCNLRCIEIDNSGSCLSIRKYHPMISKGYIRPIIELPKASLHHFTIEEGVLTDCMKVKFHTRSRKRHFKLTLYFFSKQNIAYFQKSMQTVSIDI